MRLLKNNAFTIIELLVSFAVLSVLLVMMLQLLGTTQKTWENTTNNASRYKEARLAFETVSRKLKEATLNQFWDYQYDSNAKPIRYTRESDLHFVSGKMNDIAGTDTLRFPTFGVFFQAPFGYQEERSSRGLTQSLNSWGYFIEYSDDKSQIPPFLQNTVQKKHRFRLVEFRKPVDEMDIFNNTEERRDSFGPADNFWFEDHVDSPADAAYRRVVADNIVALIVSPLRADPSDASNVIPLPYEYNSRAGKSETSPHARQTLHLLPPLVRITMVAVDERSAAQRDWSTRPPPLVPDYLFQFPEDYEKDMELLTEALTDQNLDFNVFSTTFPMPAAKWSNPEWLK
ncbi:MAG: Verru_Chthon cassette protein C [Verrucomicrobiota bacterium]